MYVSEGVLYMCVCVHVNACYLCRYGFMYVYLHILNKYVHGYVDLLRLQNKMRK